MTRGRFKNLKSEAPLAIIKSGPQWICGADLPIFWTREELYLMEKQTIYDNFKRGAIDKHTKNMMMKTLRKQRSCK